MRAQLITIFLWCLTALLSLLACVAHGQNPTPIYNLSTTNVVRDTNWLGIVSHPGQTNGTRKISVTNFLESLKNLPNWPIGTGSGIQIVRSNGVTITSSATALDVITGSNTLVLATNSGGVVQLQINSIASAGGAATNIYTNIVYVNAVGDRYQSATALTNAIYNAPTGSLVVVGPGIYDLPTNSVPSMASKTDVDQFWMPNSIFVVGNSNEACNMFDDSDLVGGSTPTRMKILGYGRFYITNGTASIVALENTNSSLVFEADEIRVHGAPTATAFNIAAKNASIRFRYAYVSDYDLLICNGAAESIRMEFDEADVGQDIVETGEIVSTNLGNIFVAFNRASGAWRAAGSTLMSLGGNTVVKFGVIENTNNGFIKTFGTNYAQLIGGTIITRGTGAITNLFGSPGNPNYGHSSLWLRNVVIDGPNAYPPFVLTNYHSDLPLRLENCTIISSAAHWAAKSSTRSLERVQILGTLAFPTFIPAAAGINFVSGTSVDDLYVMGDVHASNDIYAASLSLSGLLSVSGGLDEVSTNLVDILTEFAPAAGDKILALDVSAPVLGWIDPIKLGSNNVRVAAGTGGITVAASGAGGIMTYTVSDDDAGGSDITYVSVPTSGLVGGAQQGWSTNLSGNLLLVPTNLTADLHYFVDVHSAGAIASISNYQSIYFREQGLGGVAALGTNGSSTLELWRDGVSGRTNAIIHGPQFSVAPGAGMEFSTNLLTKVITLAATNTSGTLTNAGTTNSTKISNLANSGTAIKSVEAGANITITDQGTNLVFAASSATMAAELDTLIVTNRFRHLVQVVTPAADTNAIIDLAKSANVLLVLTTNAHVVFSNVVDGIMGQILVKQDTNGARTIISSRVVGGLLITNADPFAYINTNASALERFEFGTHYATNVWVFQETIQAHVVDLQGATNGLNTRVGNLEGATNGLNTGVANLQGATNGLNTGVANLQGATNGIMTRIGNLDGSTNAIDALARTKQDGTLTLTNLSGTGAVTNLYSPTLSNATIKPLVVGVGTAAGATNATGQIRGLEAGSNVTLSENGSNVVITASAGAGVSTLFSAGNTNATALAIVHQGTNTTGGIKTVTAGSNITITENGATNLTIASTAGSGLPASVDFGDLLTTDSYNSAYWVGPELMMVRDSFKAGASVWGGTGQGANGGASAWSELPVYNRPSSRSGYWRLTVTNNNIHLGQFRYASSQLTTNFIWGTNSLFDATLLLESLGAGNGYTNVNVVVGLSHKSGDSPPNMTYGIFFELRGPITGGSWVAVTRYAGSTTTNILSDFTSTNEWVRLTITGSTNSGIVFLTNGVPAVTNSANIPIGVRMVPHITLNGAANSTSPYMTNYLTIDTINIQQ